MLMIALSEFASADRNRFLDWVHDHPRAGLLYVLAEMAVFAAALLTAARLFGWH